MTGLQGAELLNIRAPRLVGVIGADTIWGGLLMTLVPASSDLSDLNCSGDSAPRLQATTAERQQWFDEIFAAFDGFHRYGFAYGDVKPANILIDDDRQAWLIDFEGGVTQGWVDEDLLDTVEGDLQGLGRLREFLGLEE
jgi:tRNA A-37 threonylcarbamoyl transferase component Bud32